MMTLEQAREILGEEIRKDNSLLNEGGYLNWPCGDARANLDGDFTADELEAIAVWMRAHDWRKG